MVKEQNYSKRELDHFLGEWGLRMDKQDSKLEEILGQTTRHNGRMTKLEDKVSDYQEVKNQIHIVSNWKLEFMAEIKGMRRIMVAVVIVLPTLISTIFVLYINSLRQNIINDASEAVVSTLEEKYDLKVTND